MLEPFTIAFHYDEDDGTHHVEHQFEDGLLEDVLQNAKTRMTRARSISQLAPAYRQPRNRTEVVIAKPIIINVSYSLLKDAMALQEQLASHGDGATLTKKYVRRTEPAHSPFCLVNDTGIAVNMKFYETGKGNNTGFGNTGRLTPVSVGGRLWLDPGQMESGRMSGGIDARLPRTMIVDLDDQHCPIFGVRCCGIRHMQHARLQGVLRDVHIDEDTGNKVVLLRSAVQIDNRTGVDLEAEMDGNPGLRFEIKNKAVTSVPVSFNITDWDDTALRIRPRSFTGTVDDFDFDSMKPIPIKNPLPAGTLPPLAPLTYYGKNSTAFHCHVAWKDGAGAGDVPTFKIVLMPFMQLVNTLPFACKMELTSVGGDPEVRTVEVGETVIMPCMTRKKCNEGVTRKGYKESESWRVEASIEAVDSCSTEAVQRIEAAFVVMDSGMDEKLKSSEIAQNWHSIPDLQDILEHVCGNTDGDKITDVMSILPGMEGRPASPGGSPSRHELTMEDFVDLFRFRPETSANKKKATKLIYHEGSVAGRKYVHGRGTADVKDDELHLANLKGQWKHQDQAAPPETCQKCWNLQVSTQAIPTTTCSWNASDRLLVITAG